MMVMSSRKKEKNRLLREPLVFTGAVSRDNGPCIGCIGVSAHNPHDSNPIQTDNARPSGQRGQYGQGGRCLN